MIMSNKRTIYEEMSNPQDHCGGYEMVCDIRKMKTLGSEEPRAIKLISASLVTTALRVYFIGIKCSTSGPREEAKTGSTTAA